MGYSTSFVLILFLIQRGRSTNYQDKCRDGVSVTEFTIGEKATLKIDIPPYLNDDNTTEIKSWEIQGPLGSLVCFHTNVDCYYKNIINDRGCHSLKVTLPHFNSEYTGIWNIHIKYQEGKQQYEDTNYIRNFSVYGIEPHQRISQEFLDSSNQTSEKEGYNELSDNSSVTPSQIWETIIFVLLLLVFLFIQMSVILIVYYCKKKTNSWRKEKNSKLIYEAVE